MKYDTRKEQKRKAAHVTFGACVLHRHTLFESEFLGWDVLQMALTAVCTTVQGASPISAPTQRSLTALRHDSYNTSNGSTLVSFVHMNR